MNLTDRQDTSDASESLMNQTLPPWLILLLLCLLMAAMRYYTFDEPFERDITTQAVTAHEILNGKKIYTDIFSDRPPLLQATYALGELIAGFGLWQIYLLWIVPSIITLIGVYYCATARNNETSTGLWAATFWAVISCDPFVQANQPNTEVFINSCLIWILALILRDDGKGSGQGRAVAIGILLALGSLYKYHVVFMALALGFVHVALPPGGIENRGRALRQLATSAGVSISAWVGLFAYFYALGRFEEFWNDLFVYMAHYGGDLSYNLIQGASPKNFLPDFMYGEIPLIAVCVIGAGLYWNKKVDRTAACLIAYAGAVALMVAIPGKFFPHYYQFWLPLLTFGGAKAITAIADLKGEEAEASLKGMGVALVIILLVIQVRHYFITPDNWARMKYGDLFAETQRVGRVINDVLKPDETFFNWGMDSGLHFYSRKPLPSGVGVWPPVFLIGPLIEPYSLIFKADMVRNKPEMLIAAPYFPQTHEMFQWLLESYAVFPDNTPYAPFKFYYRKGGALEQRLRASGAFESPASNPS
ncbi:MAG: hypothetical protein G3M78_08075 [Candidatus Nitrohelix vancouverensis]|uniref:Glycosyltransferase RgtA/B/C/D-like domain-containing protein n=1 Tax=Candidatus Nitrohelix vancouverensis TaxID=2705534 RepID=A0A7T0C2H5_9BACT|nr:MAG: hypothetical protein G3M78_08075 [Candidatus Nitrohelix vancouverensis]